MKALLMFLAVSLGLSADSLFASHTSSPPERTLGIVAQGYVRLVLGVGQHDPDYVDAYYGPVEWRQAAEHGKRSLEDLAGDAQALHAQLHAVDPSRLQGMLLLRWQFLAAQLRSVEGRIALLSGRKVSFDEESRLLYDAVLPEYPAGHFAAIRSRLSELLPGDAPLEERLEHYQNRFIVPRHKVEAVMRAAVAECRRRTLVHIALPQQESFRLELVTGQPWAAYNWYKGGAQSVIQINLDMPFRMNLAIELAAHEGYPGHHVANALLEQEFSVTRGWVEFQVYPLFSPQSLVFEGSADYGIEVVFPMSERVRFAQEVLFPLAGLDPGEAARYFEVIRLAELELNTARNHIHRRYLDGGLGRDEALRLLSTDGLLPRDRAGKMLEFSTKYRAYLVTYDAGALLVKAHVEARGGILGRESRRWEIFRELLSAPQTPAGLAQPLEHR